MSENDTLSIKWSDCQIISKQTTVTEILSAVHTVFENNNLTQIWHDYSSIFDELILFMQEDKESFRQYQRIIFIDYLEKGITITGAYYSSLLDSLKAKYQENKH